MRVTISDEQRKEGRERGLHYVRIQAHGHTFPNFQRVRLPLRLDSVQHISLLSPLNELDSHSAWVALAVQEAAAVVARPHPIPHLLAFQFQGTLTTTKRLRSNNILVCTHTIGSLECILRLVEPCLRHGVSGPAARAVCLESLPSKRASEPSLPQTESDKNMQT